MIKQIIALIGLSILVVLSMSYAQQGMEALVSAHEWISQILTEVFSGGQAGNLARGLIALLSIPILVGLIPTVIYWIVKRSWFPYFMEIVWIVWLIQAGALMVMAR
ncbi:hypothetical protein [Aquicella lusitana]|uniref:DUF1634 domain-containing protein n=1 Tax=Aquicella lusitana TaxID=254246 RepID=A0A370GBZ2_9COXI|nr:hypothetical protein [Aquicella lusitana]RDI41325.1 hypothetical protein C8D86_12025 [Aquicella lusitana]VVC72309.1 hypothetical protein AQULUS_00190 [Aquicella lusitana]